MLGLLLDSMTSRVFSDQNDCDSVVAGQWKGRQKPLLRTRVLVLNGYVNMCCDSRRNKTVGIDMEVVESKLKIAIMLLYVCVVCHYGKCCAALGPFLRPQKIQKHLKKWFGGEGKERDGESLWYCEWCGRIKKLSVKQGLLSVGFVSLNSSRVFSKLTGELRTTH